MFKNKLENLEKGLIIISYIIFGIGLSISIILIYILYQHTSLVTASDSINNELTGVIGDFFGGVVGTLFALVSVLLFYLAFQHQKRELKSTNEAFRQQQFENTFFNLLKNQNDIRDNLFHEFEKKEPTYRDQIPLPYIEKTKTKIRSLEFFKLVKQKIETRAKLLETNLGRDFSREDLNEFFTHYKEDFNTLKSNPILKSQVIYRIVYNNYKEDLGHYFRNLYHLLLFLKNSEEELLEIQNSEKEKKRIRKDFLKYANFIQAQLSGTEMFLIFYDALFFRRFKKLIQHYKIVENLNIDDLLYPEYDYIYYAKYISNIDEKKEEIEGLIFKSRSEDLKIKNPDRLDDK